MKILLVSAYAPSDTSFGGGQRTHMLHNALLRTGDVTTLVLRERLGATATLSKRVDGLAEIEFAPTPLWRRYTPVPAIAPLIREAVELDAFDVVVGREIFAMAALPAFKGRSIVDADDAAYHYPPANVPLIGPLLSFVRGKLRQTASRRALKGWDHVWLASERDRQAFNLPNSSILPNVVLPRPCAHSSAGPSQKVLFVGALWYRPNRDAVEWFIAHCWPRLQQRFPGAIFRAVGAAPPSWRERWSTQPGVECPGFVDDLGLEYATACATVAPIRSGGGTQIKVLESLAHGVLPVVTPFVAGGFAPHLAQGCGLAVADDVSGFVECLTSALRDPITARVAARQGQQALTTHFSQECFAQAVTFALRQSGTRD